MDSLRSLHPITFLLTAIGALNWGLIGLFDFNLINFIFVRLPLVEQIIYIIIGLSALIEIITHGSNCKFCSGKTTIYHLDPPQKPKSKSSKS